MDESNQIKESIDNFNSGWLYGNLKKSETCLHDDVVFVSPDFIQKLSGKENCLKTLEEYISVAKTKRFKIIKEDISVWDNTANAIIEYEIEYEIDAKTYCEKGRELWTLLKNDEYWKIIWRGVLGNEKM
jgi:hypothetical protein